MADTSSDRISRRYEFLRQQQEQDATAQKQQNAEGLERKAASTGRLGSGIYQKLGAEQAQQIDKQKARNLSDIEAARDTQLGAVEEAQKGRDFAAAQAVLQRAYGTSEREAGQGFAGAQADIQRRYGSAEREAGQGFQLGLLGKQQSFATSEREAGQSFNKKIFDLQQSWARELSEVQQGQFAQTFNDNKRQWEHTYDLSVEQLSQQSDQFKQQYELDKEVSAFNMKMAQAQFDKPTMLGGLTRVMNGDFSGLTGGGGRGRWGAERGGVAVYTGGVSEFMPAQGGGGGKIICTEYARLGWLPKHILAADLDYQRRFAPVEHIKNYLAWAKYIVPLIRTNIVIRYLFWPLTKCWTNQMAWRMGVVKKKPLCGFLFETILLRISNMIGSNIRARRKTYLKVA